MKPFGATTTCPGNEDVRLPSEVPQKVPLTVVIALFLWMAVVGGATIQMARYASIPGTDGSAPIAWPAETRIPFDHNRSTLVMFTHPHCPCTRASLGELERLLAEVPNQFSARVVFLKPAGANQNWEITDLWRKALSITGVTVHVDNEGVEARRFHSDTSGQTLLYHPNGSLQFQGGITAARGHAGDNAGRAALKRIALGKNSNGIKTPVFGCALFEADCQKGNSECKP